MVPVESFDAEEVLKAVDQEGCSALLGVPTMFIAELDHPDFEQYDTSSLRTGIMAGSPCPMEVMKKVVDVIGAGEITIAYRPDQVSPVIPRPAPTTRSSFASPASDISSPTWEGTHLERPEDEDCAPESRVECSPAATTSCAAITRWRTGPPRS